MFIAVSGPERRMHEVPAYLYSGQSVAVGSVAVGFGSSMLIVDTGSENAYRANYVAGRLQSGMFGTAVFDTLEEAKAYVEATKL